MVGNDNKEKYYFTVQPQITIENKPKIVMIWKAMPQPIVTLYRYKKITYDMKNNTRDKY